MKSDMDYKEKYEQALQRAKQFSEKPFLEDSKGIVDYIFPELKESEEESIRKRLIELLKKNDEQHYAKEIAWLEKQSTPQVRTGLEWVNTIDDACDKRYSEEYAHGEYCHEQSFKWGFQEGVDWLEKQGEQNPISLEDAAKLFLEKLSESPYNNKPITDAQVITKELINFLKDTNTYNPNAINEQKPAEWNEEDINMFGSILSTLGVCANNPQIPADIRSIHKKEESWFNKLYHRVLPEQEWSEEDEKMLDGIVGILESWDCSHTTLDGALPSIVPNYVRWFKSLRYRSGWKPSESDILLLERIANGKSNPQDFQASLGGLIEQLKKLRKE